MKVLWLERFGILVQVLEVEVSSPQQYDPIAFRGPTGAGGLSSSGRSFAHDCSLVTQPLPQLSSS